MYTYRILQNWREDTFHSSILTFEKNSYLFNCCDGTQRNALDQGVKFSKIKAIFYNSSHSECYLGTYGLMMSRGEQVFSQLIAQKNTITKSDNNESSNNNNSRAKETAYAKKNKIIKEKGFTFPKQADLYGPPLFSSNFANTNMFCPVPLNKLICDLNYQTNSFMNTLSGNTISIVKDENITIIPICVNKGDFANKNDYALSFIIIPSQKNPPFLAEKAKELGLKPGPAFGKLQKGESVFLENGTEIKPEMVLGEPELASSLCIFYILSLEYMHALITNQLLLGYLKDNNTKRYSNTLAVHIIPNIDIINNSEYKKFMELFGKDNVHIIDCKETNRKFMYNEGKIKIKKILNYVDSSLFSNGTFAYEDTLPKINLNEYSSTMPDSKIIDSIPGFEYIQYSKDKTAIISKGLYDNEAFYHKSDSNTKFSQQLDEIIQKINKDNIVSPITPVKHISPSNKLPTITFLGTTSMKPCKFRNVTSIMIHLPSDTYILFDCGEGTYQQILEHNGIKKTNEILSKMRLIAISHKHGDHMLGLIKMLYEVDKQINANTNVMIKEHFFIIVPKTIIDFVKQSINFDIINKPYFIVIESSFLNPNQQYLYDLYLKQDNPHEGFKDIDKETNYSITKTKIDLFTQSAAMKDLYIEFQASIGVHIYSIEVFHCDESFGYFIESSPSKNNQEDYYKISFSGDTRPNNNFFNYSMNSSVLIHEGTFDDEMINDAKDKMHSTLAEAIALGKDNNSKRIIITHFSPRYIKCYPYKDLFDKEQILLSHDYLSFSLSNLDWAFSYLKPFDKIITTIEENKDENIL